MKQQQADSIMVLVDREYEYTDEWLSRMEEMFNSDGWKEGFPLILDLALSEVLSHLGSDLPDYMLQGINGAVGYRRGILDKIVGIKEQIKEMHERKDAEAKEGS